mmetsp:Transcript_101999/g.311980  ORF Transcript_101999/g.311980 Transcript_101999/m.311980 type:complete len:264 (-) Transcript_101999:342-1133(-)
MDRGHPRSLRGPRRAHRRLAEPAAARRQGGRGGGIAPGGQVLQQSACQHAEEDQRVGGGSRPAPPDHQRAAGARRALAGPDGRRRGRERRVGEERHGQLGAQGVGRGAPERPPVEGRLPTAVPGLGAAHPALRHGAGAGGDRFEGLQLRRLHHRRRRRLCRLRRRPRLRAAARDHAGDAAGHVVQRREAVHAHVRVRDVPGRGLDRAERSVGGARRRHGVRRRAAAAAPAQPPARRPRADAGEAARAAEGPGRRAGQGPEGPR